MISENMRKQIVVNDQVYLVETLDCFWDKAYEDEERNRFMRGMLRESIHAPHHGGTGILLIYSVISRESFEEARVIYKAIRQEELLLPPLSTPGKEQNTPRRPVPIVLVGNKADISTSDPTCALEKRQVSYVEGTNLAKELGCVSFSEVSAKTAVNVNQAFCSLITALSHDEDLGHGMGSAEETRMKEGKQDKHIGAGSRPTVLRRWGDRLRSLSRTS
jgi:GTPase SAR1 family protein